MMTELIMAARYPQVSFQGQLLPNPGKDLAATLENIQYRHCYQLNREIRGQRRVIVISMQRARQHRITAQRDHGRDRL